MDLIPNDIDILTLLGLWGDIDLSKFCVNSVKYLYKEIEYEQFHMKSQNIRNRIEKLYKRGLIQKVDGKKKKIKLTDTFVIYKNKNILLNYNILSIESN
jgi:hypothetical protein